MRLLIMVLLLHNITYSHQYYQIEDIPIENFERGNIGDDAFDFELMPRSSRSLFKDEPIVDNIGISRFKRSTPGQISGNEESVKNLVIGLGKPLEVSVIDPLHISEKSLEETESSIGGRPTNDNVLINDFIRFRRSSEQETMTETIPKSMDSEKDTDNSKSSPNLYKKDIETFNQPQKFVIAPNAPTKESAREARGITKEQWVKQPYPVRKPDDNYEDSSQSSSDSVRAPRVHFVTQTREPEVKYNRDVRARSLNREIPRDLARDMDNYQPRYMRPWRGDFDYNSPSRNYRDPYYYDRMDDYRDRTRNRYEDMRRPQRKQKRIIYYATLPDVTRNPQTMDKRERYDYRDRYDDRYYTPDPYRYRYKEYMKPRYEENIVRGEKSPYSLKVSTDLSVRELKKIPERHYTEVNRSRYAPNIPYQSDRM